MKGCVACQWIRGTCMFHLIQSGRGLQERRKVPERKRTAAFRPDGVSAKEHEKRINGHYMRLQRKRRARLQGMGMDL